MSLQHPVLPDSYTPQNSPYCSITSLPRVSIDSFLLVNPEALSGFGVMREKKSGGQSGGGSG